MCAVSVMPGSGGVCPGGRGTRASDSPLRSLHFLVCQAYLRPGQLGEPKPMVM